MAGHAVVVCKVYGIVVQEHLWLAGIAQGHVFFMDHVSLLLYVMLPCLRAWLWLCLWIALVLSFYSFSEPQPNGAVLVVGGWKRLHVLR